MDLSAEYLALGEHVDRLITTDARCKGFTLPLYEASRRVQGNCPLTLAAASRLSEVIDSGRKDVVLLLTGFPSATLFGRGEQDGPVGTACIARGLAQAFNVTPVLLIDAAQISEIQATCRAAGLNVFDLKEGLHAGAVRGKSVSVVPFPIDEDEARRFAAELLDLTMPVAVIAVERPSGNENGIYHNIAGQALNEITAKTDVIFHQARAQNILTVAIADGGNELGCGLIYDDARSIRPNGARCTCGCGGTILARSPADVLVWSSISDWGAMGVLTCLAAISGRPEALPSEQVLGFTLQQASFAGLHDGMGGWLDPGSDGVRWDLEVGVLGLLHNMLGVTLENR